MKLAIALAAILISCSAASAQQMSCRPLEKGNVYIMAGESVIQTETGREACRLIEPTVSKPAGVPSVPEQTQEDTRPRIYITDSQSWEASGGWSGHTDRNGNYHEGGGFSGGARPQNAELVKTFREKCLQIVVNNKLEKADFVVTFEKEGGKGIARKSDKIAVFNRDGDAIYSGSTHSLGNAVKDACSAITSFKR